MVISDGDEGRGGRHENDMKKRGEDEEEMMRKRKGGEEEVKMT